MKILFKDMGKYRMSEAWGYQESNGYLSRKTIIDNRLSENEKNDAKTIDNVQKLANTKIDEVKYDPQAKLISFKANGKDVSSIDASDFIKDGMIDNVVLDGNKLKITFNTESGKEVIEVDMTELFNADDYYTKEQVDAFLNVKANTTDVITEINNAVAPLATKNELTEYAKTADVIADISNATAPLAVKEEVNSTIATLLTKNDAANTYATKQSITVFAKQSDVNTALANKANTSDVEALNDSVRQLSTSVSEKASTASLEAAKTDLNNAINAVNTKVDNIDVNSFAKKTDIEGIQSQIDSIDFDSFATKTELNAVEAKVDSIVVPSLDGYATQAWVEGKGYLTEHQDLTSYATVSAVDANVAALTQKDNEQDTAIALKADAATVYTQEEVNNLIKNKEKEIYDLKKIIGDIGGKVTYELPNELGTTFNTLMLNNGTVKLTEDVTASRLGPGILASNKVTLNLNSHDLTITGLTQASAFPAIMARNSQEITIGGKGTIDAGEGIAVEANGVNTVINLTGSTTVYQTNRPDGELIYCYAGTINIKNGTFKNNGSKFLINCYDANYKNGTAKIIVTGGKFYDFDPGNNAAEGVGTSYLEEGYESVASTVVEEGVEHIVYTVKKASA